LALEPEDRTEEIVGNSKPMIDAKQSIAQAPKKMPGTCRLVVEFPFEFSHELLVEKGKQYQGRPFLDGVEYLRYLQRAFEVGDLDLGDLQNLSAEHSQNGVRAVAAK